MCRYETVSTLLQYYLLMPLMHKDLYLVHVLTRTSAAARTIIFTRTVHECARVALVLRLLAFGAVPIHGQLSQSSRLGALNKFKASSTGGAAGGAPRILVATDVASRGLDIPSVDLVVNYDVPSSSKDYIHRVGRTARAGRSGKSVTFVTQYDVEVYQRIEHVLGFKMPEWDLNAGGGGGGKDEVMLLRERVGEAQREAVKELKEQQHTMGHGGKKRRRRDDGDDDGDDRDRDDDVVEAGSAMMRRKKGSSSKAGGKRRR